MWWHWTNSLSAALRGHLTPSCWKLNTARHWTLLLIEQLSDPLSCQIVKRLKSNSQDALCNRIKMTIGPLTAQVRIKHNVQCTQSGNPQRQVLVWLLLHLQVAERGESPLGGLHSLHTVCSPPPAWVASAFLSPVFSWSGQLYSLLSVEL